MSSLFDFDAPQFINRRDIDPSTGDAYFDIKEKLEKERLRKSEAGAKDTFDEVTTTSKVRKTKVVFPDDEKENTGGKYTINRRLTTPKPNRTHIDEDLLNKIDSLQIDSSRKTFSKTPKKFEGIPLVPTSDKKHRMITRTDARTPVIHLRSRSVPRNTNDDDEDDLLVGGGTTKGRVQTPFLKTKVAQLVETEDETDDSMVSAVSSTSPRGTFNLPAPGHRHYHEEIEDTNPTPPDRGTFFIEPDQTRKFTRLKRTSQHFPEKDLAQKPATKFIALAEAVNKFHYGTPDRFRSKPLPWKPTMMKPARLGLPKSPKLTAVTRNRPVHYEGQKQREQREYEEMLKFQIKPTPIDEKALRGASIATQAPKAAPRRTTVVQPFNLTETKPKPVPKEEVFQFKAQPVPKGIFENPIGIPPKEPRPPTTPKTPAIVMPRRVKVSPALSKDSLRSSTESLAQPRIVKPFSFEERDKLALARKEQLIKKVLEEEKKSFSSFRAQPVKHFKMCAPTPVKALEPKKTEPAPFNLTKPGQFAPLAKVEPEVKFEFKAHPASVLKRRPFLPQHKHDTPKVVPFSFKTDERLAERKKFEDQLSKQQEEREKINQKIREEEEARAREELLEIRRQAEFKAHPVPKLKPFKLQESQIPLTTPMTPPFHHTKSKQ